MIDLKSYVLSLLSSVPACTALAYSREDHPLPLIVLSDDSIRVAAQADGQDYLKEYFLSLDVYAAHRASLESLCLEAHQALAEGGLRLADCQDLYDEEACCYRRHLRYRALIQGDTIYQ